MVEEHHAVDVSQSASNDGDSAQHASQLEMGSVGMNSNPNPQLFIVQSEKVPPPTNGDASDAVSLERPKTLLENETYPEGGLEAWLVVFGAFCGLFASLGLLNTIATFQTYTATHQLSDYSEGTVGWIYSINVFLAFGCGVYIGPLFDKYGPRWLLLPGSAGIFVSMMLLSVCTHYWHFVLVFSILNGLCASLLFTPCFAAVGHFFRARRGLATGIASTGGGVGGVVFPLVLERLFDRVGWAWAVRIIGFICLVLMVICNILVKKRLPAAGNASSHPDFRILGDTAFLLTTIGVFFLEFGLFIPVAYISSYALHQGFSSSFSYTILTVLNASSVFGRALPGYWADKIGPFNSNILSVLLSIIASFAVWLPAGHTLPGIVIFAILFGFATGNNISITPVCVGRLCHTQEYGRYYATCYTVVSFACLIGNPIAGSIVAATPGGSYWGLIVITGVTEVLSLVALVLARGSKLGWKKPWAKF